MGKRKQLKATVVLVLTAMALVSACGSDSKGSAAGGNTAEQGSLKKELATYFAGTDRPLPDSGPKSVGPKKVWVLPCSSAAPGCGLPAQAAVAAGKALGWDMTLVDGKFDPNTQSNQVRAAAAAGADGLITVAVDCPTIAGPLKDAVAGGMKVMSVYGYDCDNAFTKGESLFSAEMNFGPHKNYEGLIKSDYAKAIAAYMAGLAGGDAKKVDIIEFRENDLLVTQTLSEAFNGYIKACNCDVHTVTFTGQDLISGKLQQKASAAISRFPNATAVMAPYDATILLGIGAAVEQARTSGRKITLTGGEGLPPNVDLIKKGDQQFAAGLPTEWPGWAIVDAMNREFAGEPQVDEGIGIQPVDKAHPGGCRPIVSGTCVDFKAAYKKIWDVS